MLKNTTSVRPRNLTFYPTQPTLVTPTQSNNILVVAVSLGTVFAVVVLGLAIFYLCMRRNRQRRLSTEGHVQGLFSIVIMKIFHSRSSLIDRGQLFLVDIFKAFSESTI